jgi:hypothetical protein
MAYEPKKDIRMAAKRHKAKEIVRKLRQVDVLNAQGKSMAEATRSIGVTEVTYYRWRAEYGGLKGDQVKRLKELEDRERLDRRVKRFEGEQREHQNDHDQIVGKPRAGIGEECDISDRHQQFVAESSLSQQPSGAIKRIAKGSEEVIPACDFGRRLFKACGGRRPAARFKCRFPVLCFDRAAAGHAHEVEPLRQAARTSSLGW